MAVHAHVLQDGFLETRITNCTSEVRIQMKLFTEREIKSIVVLWVLCSWAKSSPEGGKQSRGLPGGSCASEIGGGVPD